MQDRQYRRCCYVNTIIALVSKAEYVIICARQLTPWPREVQRKTKKIKVTKESKALV